MTAPRAVLDLDGDDPASRTDHRRIAGDLADTQWLPRGSVLGAAAALLPDHPVLRRIGVCAFPAAALAVLVCLVVGHAGAARWTALLVLAAYVMAVAIVVPARLDALALLRLPAATVVGLGVLLSLTPRWWLASGGWKVGLGLMLVAGCYVVFESRMHGVDRGPALFRGAYVWVVGLLHAFVLSMVFLGFVVPVMGENGQCLAGWWSSGPFTARQLSLDCQRTVDATVAAAPAGVLLLMTGWSLAIGLVAQILWDDRPVTSPLGRLRRIRGTRP